MCTAVIYGVVEYLYQHGRWHPHANPTPSVVVILGWVHIVGIVVAVAAAVVGLAVEKPPFYALSTLILGFLSFLIYVG